MIVLIAVAVVAGSAVWVYMDAQQRDWSRTNYATASARWWGGMTVLLWVVYLPWYLAARRHAPRYERPLNDERPPGR